jgi:hypothetical protein
MNARNLGVVFGRAYLGQTPRGSGLRYCVLHPATLMRSSDPSREFADMVSAEDKTIANSNEDSNFHFESTGRKGFIHRMDDRERTSRIYLASWAGETRIDNVEIEAAMKVNDTRNVLDTIPLVQTNSWTFICMPLKVHNRRRL